MKTLDPREIAASVQEYLQNRSIRERSEFHEGRLKKDLMSLLEIAGEPVETHKQIIELDAPLVYQQYKNGKPVPKSISGIERRERVSTRMDEEAALKLLAKKDLTKECTVTHVVVDEDAILAANFAGKITDKELATLYSDSSTFAFYLTEEPS